MPTRTTTIDYRDLWQPTTTTTIDYRDLWQIAGNTTWSTTANTGGIYQTEPATTAYWHSTPSAYYDNIVDTFSSSELQKIINSFSSKDLKPDPEKLLDLLEA